MKYVKLVTHSPQLKLSVNLLSASIKQKYFLDLQHISQIFLGIDWASGLQDVELLDVVIPQHGGGQLGVEVGVVPGASHYLVLGVN